MDQQCLWKHKSRSQVETAMEVTHAAGPSWEAAQLCCLIASQYAEADRAICGHGNFILRPSHQKYCLHLWLESGSASNSSSDDGNLTVLHCPDPGEKLSSCRRPWADRTMTQNKKGSSVVLCNAPLRSFAVFSHTDFYRAMLCIRGTSHDPVSVCLSVSLSVTSRCSTKTAKQRITQTTSHDTPGTLVYWCQRSPRNSTGVTPYEGAECRWGG